MREDLPKGRLGGVRLVHLIRRVHQVHIVGDLTERTRRRALGDERGAVGRLEQLVGVVFLSCLAELGVAGPEVGVPLKTGSVEVYCVLKPVTPPVNGS